MKCPISFRTLISILTAICVCLFLIKGVEIYLKLLYKPDYRVETIGIITQHPFEGDTSGLHLRKIEHRFKMENFQLIQMMNETNPNIISNDALLVISASHSSVESSYAHLLEKIQNTCSTNNSLPFYLLRKSRSLIMHNSKSVREEVNQIVQVLQYFTDSLLIKRLTILSFEEGSLFTLRALAYIKYDTFSIIDKLVLFNPFSPMITILHGNAGSFLTQTKSLILSDAVRTQLTNSTRIIIIHTIHNNAGDQKINWLFKNTKGESVTFANSLVIQTKYMWNVYSYLKTDQYFRFQPLLDIVTRFVHEDRAGEPLTVKEIYFLFLYREISLPKELSFDKKTKVLSRCSEYFLENYNIEGGFLYGECVKIVRKEDFYFNQHTTLILRSLGKFQVYGENFQKIMPYDTKDNKETVYLLENVLAYRRVFLINPKSVGVHILVQPSLRPQIVISKNSWFSNQLIPINDNKIYYSVRTLFERNTTQPISLCPGQTILHPSNLTIYGIFLHETSQLNFEYQLDCYWSIDPYVSLLHNLLRYWSFGFNMMVFSLFCAHVLKTSTFSRFYLQYTFNLILTYLHLEVFLISENFLVLAVVVLMEQLLRLATFMSNMIYMPKKIVSKVMWLPLLFEILKWLNINSLISPWKTLGLIFFAGTKKNNIILLYLKFAYILQFIIMDISHPQSLFLCCAWLANSSEQKTNESDKLAEISKKLEIQKAQMIILRTGSKIKWQKEEIIRKCKQVIDTLAVCIMGLCLTEEGVILHHILDFYIVCYVVFSVQQQVQEWG